MWCLGHILSLVGENGQGCIIYKLVATYHCIMLELLANGVYTGCYIHIDYVSGLSGVIDNNEIREVETKFQH